MSEIYSNLKSLVESNKELKITNIELIHDNLILTCDRESLIQNIDTLKRNVEFKFRQLIDILGIDYPQKDKRFEVVKFHTAKLLLMEGNLAHRYLQAQFDRNL